MYVLHSSEKDAVYLDGDRISIAQILMGLKGGDWKGDDVKTSILRKAITVLQVMYAISSGEDNNSGFFDLFSTFTTHQKVNLKKNLQRK